MTPPRLLAPAIVAVLAGALGVATVGAAPASARPAQAAADRCLDRSAIPVRALRTVARAGCPLVGRLVTDGRVSVVVPPAGMSVSGDGVGRHGDVRGLTVVDTGTTVRALRAGAAGGTGGWYIAPLPSVTSQATTTPTTGMLTTVGTTPSTTLGTTLTSGFLSTAPTPKRAALGACQDRTYHLEGGHSWVHSLSYHVNLSKMPRRFSAKTVVRQWQAANANMRLGRNTCGKPRLSTPVSHYLGRTTRKPNISTNGPTCGTGNRTNVMGFASLPGGLLGWTCYWYNSRGHMVGVDMLIDNGRYLATTLPARCSNRWDFEGTVTHEWGHAYGLAHSGAGHPNLTMQHQLKPCSTYARTLGLGDWLGMNKLYGHQH